MNFFINIFVYRLIYEEKCVTIIDIRTPGFCLCREHLGCFVLKKVPHERMVPVARVQADMTKTEFIGKLERELWKFAGKCREKALALKFIKTVNTIRLTIRTESEWHYIFIGKNRIIFRASKYRFFADRRVVYYKWRKKDDHDDVVEHFTKVLNQYARCIFPTGRNGGTYGFYHALQSYDMQKYMDELTVE